MKKVLSVLLLLIYAHALVGTDVRLHLCHGEVQGVSLLSESGDLCEESGSGCLCALDAKSCTPTDSQAEHHEHDEEHEKCCEEQSVLYKLDAPQKLSSEKFLFFPLHTEIYAQPETAKQYCAVGSRTELPPVKKLFPPPRGVPLFLSNCSLIFYG